MANLSARGRIILRDTEDYSGGMHVSVVDLFCGVGGLTYGLKSAGLSVEAGIDVDEDCRHPYVTNTGAAFLPGDLGKVARDAPGLVDGIFDTDADATVLAGCAPCQPFSCLTHGQDSEKHAKWGLLEAFRELVEHVQPDVQIGRASCRERVSSPV